MGWDAEPVAKTTVHQFESRFNILLNQKILLIVSLMVISKHATDF